MKLLTLLTSFVVALSLLLEPCLSADKQLYVQHFDDHLTRLSLPRKLNFHEAVQVKTSADDQHNNFEQPLSDTKQEEKEKKVMNEGRVFEEGPNKSEYFTMDYGWVRRRRPIHNKQIPFLP